MALDQDTGLLIFSEGAFLLPSLDTGVVYLVTEGEQVIDQSLAEASPSPPSATTSLQPPPSTSSLVLDS